LTNNHGYAEKVESTATIAKVDVEKINWADPDAAQQAWKMAQQLTTKES